MKIPFDLTVNGHVNFPNHTVEIEISPLYWSLYCKKVPEKGLVVLLRVGPFGLFIYNLKKQDEWFEQLIERKEGEE